MPTPIIADLSRLLKLWKGPKDQLPTDGPEEKLFFVMDTPVIEVYQGNGLNKPLRRISNLIHTTPDIKELEDIEEPLDQVIYVVVDDKGYYTLGIHTGTEWVVLADTETVVLPDNEVIFSNKTIDADVNTILNLEVDNFKEGVILSALDDIVANDNLGEASPEKLITEKAFVEYIQQQFLDRINLMEFMGIVPVITLQALQKGDIGNYYVVADEGELAGVPLESDDIIIVIRNFENRNIEREDFYLIACADVNKVLRPDAAQTVTNKIIDAKNNTITNIGYKELDPVLLVEDIIDTEGSDETLPTSLAVQKALDAFAIVWEDGNVSPDEPDPEEPGPEEPGPEEPGPEEPGPEEPGPENPEEGDNSGEEGNEGGTDEGKDNSDGGDTEETPNTNPDEGTGDGTETP